MTGTFKANNPINGFLLFVYGLLIKLPMFLHPGAPNTDELDGFFYRYFLQWLEPVGKVFPVIYSVIAFMLFYIQAIVINNLVNKQKLLPKPCYLAGMSYLLVTSLFVEWHVLSAPLIVSTFIVWILSRLSNLYNNPNARTILFNTGMALGIASFFYFPAIAFTLLIVVGLTITRPFKLPEWIIALFGILAPAYFYGAWLFLTDQWKNFQWPDVSVTVPGIRESGLVYVALAILALAVIIGSVFVQNNVRRLLVQSRKSWSLIYLYFVVALLVPFLADSINLGDWILAILPMSAIMAAALFYPERKWFALTIHWGLFVLTVINSYFLR